ncbi:MAG: pseudouridine-5'-phosphate glycosidase [Granulosicoccus sp.]
METDTSLLNYSKEVRQALAAGTPVVALESTIITHGMPYPDNRDTALSLEQTVRDGSATPATIAVLNGRVTVGLNAVELEMLATSSDSLKLSRADLALAVARAVNGSTTVAATMIVAELAGIEVFATGGIGGVHQAAESSFDISADLQELSKTPVTVISAGAKAILDIPKTVELLETLGVPVIAYGQDALPAFWSRDSGILAPIRCDNVVQIADFLHAREQLGIVGGVLIGNPVPADAEIPKAEMDVVIQQAIQEAARQQVSGKEVTPWLLGRIVELTAGRSLSCNQSLIVNNASLAAELAVELVARRQSRSINKAPASADHSVDP